jgi:hypothetical protein
MLLFIPRSLCALKRVAAKAEHARYGATQGIRITLASGLYRAEATDGRRAVVVQGLRPIEDPPWPGFKEVPDDACEAVVLPKDLERACKVGDQFGRFDMVGMATSGADIYLGLGNDVINTRTVEGRFPMIDNVMPKKRPMFTFRIDPKLMAETLLAIADLLPDTDKGVQCFYYGDGYPLGLCAQNPQNGMMIDALMVPLSLPQEPQKRGEKNGPPEQPEGEEAEARQPEPSEPADAESKPKRRRKLAIAQPGELPDANEQDDGGQDAPPVEPDESNGKQAKRRKTKKVAV